MGTGLRNRLNVTDAVALRGMSVSVFVTLDTSMRSAFSCAMRSSLSVPSSFTRKLSLRSADVVVRSCVAMSA